MCANAPSSCIAIGMGLMTLHDCIGSESGAQQPLPHKCVAIHGSTDREYSHWSRAGKELAWPPINTALTHTHTSSTCARENDHICCVARLGLSPVISPPFRNRPRSSTKSELPRVAVSRFVEHSWASRHLHPQFISDGIALTIGNGNMMLQNGPVSAWQQHDGHTGHSLPEALSGP